MQNIKHNADLFEQGAFAAVRNASKDGLIVASLSGEIVSWSRGAQKIYGYSAEEVIGHSFDSMVPPQDVHQIEGVLDKVRRGEAVEPYEATRFTKEGELLHVEISIEAVTDTQGRASGALAVVRDITARRQAEGTVREMEAAVQQRAVILETANRVALDILSSRTGVEALRHIADAARVLAGARYAALGVARRIGDMPQGRQELQEFVTVGITPEEQSRIGALPRGRGGMRPVMSAV